MKAITRNIDRRIWRDMMNKSGMLTLMDAQACDEWHNSLEKNDIPAISENNILSNFEQLNHDKQAVFERGVINVLKRYRGIIKRTHPVGLENRSSWMVWFLTTAGGLASHMAIDATRLLIWNVC